MDRSATRRFGAFRVGDYREVVQRRFRIIGVTREADSFSTVPILFMSYRNLQGLSELLEGNSTYILVRVQPGAEVERVAEQIRRRLPYNDVHTRQAWARQSEAYWVTTTGLGVQMGLTVFLGITVGMLTVALTLYSSALEHVKEFATVKAIGGSSWDICRIIGEQAIIVSLSGYALGLLFSVSVRSLISNHAGLSVTVSPHFALTVLLWTVVLCLGAAMLSFRRVVRIDPVLVMRG
jgi:putative ABC transport system permease protein